ETINGTNESTTVGTINKGSEELHLRVFGEYDSRDDIRKSVIPTEADETITAEDVAGVEESFKESSDITFVNGEPSIVSSMMKKTDANTVDVANNIKDGIQNYKDMLPSDVTLEPVIDTSEFIQMSIDS